MKAYMIKGVSNKKSRGGEMEKVEIPQGIITVIVPIRGNDVQARILIIALMSSVKTEELSLFDNCLNMRSRKIFISLFNSAYAIFLLKWSFCLHFL